MAILVEECSLLFWRLLAMNGCGLLWAGLGSPDGVGLLWIYRFGLFWADSHPMSILDYFQSSSIAFKWILLRIAYAWLYSKIERSRPSHWWEHVFQYSARLAWLLPSQLEMQNSCSHQWWGDDFWECSMAARVKTDMYNFKEYCYFHWWEHKFQYCRTIILTNVVISSGGSAISEIAKTMIFNNIAISIGESTISE